MEPPAGGAALAAAYDRMAADYRELWAPTLLPYNRTLLDRLPLAGARRVLDLGGGVGALVPEIGSRTDATLVETDRSIGMLRLAPAELRAVVDAMWLPFRDDAFDVVVMAFMLFHVPEPERTLVDVRRVLRPGGVAGTATWGASESYRAFDLWTEALADVAPPPEEDIPDSTETTNSPGAVTRLFEAAGFVGVETEEIPFGKAYTPESFLEHRLRIGSSRRRVERLDDEVRDALVAEMRAKLAALAPEDLVDRDAVILARGVAP